ncbi:multiple coagulation factor deficiency protein 2 homolog isoform X1 [Brevipalpus obovatus]|uniref:multiple coagulation factor deficiency protein 2 homolog isoform X1 n=1 Tax=Brevipalpus obovatus TaxID=246614 RepID=UPI003D9E5498
MFSVLIELSRFCISRSMFSSLSSSSLMILCLLLGIFGLSLGHYQQPAYGQPNVAGQPAAAQYGQPQPGSNILHDKNRIQDREHLKEHLGGVISEPDMSKMSEEELQFHYFKLHDSDSNNMLDGCELIKSLFHWHIEEHKHLGNNAPAGGPATTKIFTDVELSNMIDPILDLDDRNKDGFIDYPEFVAAQKSRGF